MASNHTTAHRIENATLRTLEFTARALPRPLALGVGAAAGAILHSAGVYRSVVAANMRHVALWDDARSREITPRLYRMMGRYIVDFLRATPGSLPYDFPNSALIADVLARGKGTIVVLGHYGNWEALASMFGRMVPELLAVAMPMRNKLVEEWLVGKRAATGVGAIRKRNALRPILVGLRRNAIIAVLIDQNARRDGTPVPFLGKPASTVRTVAGLMQHTGCSVILANATLQKNLRYLVHVEDGRDLCIPRTDTESFVDAYQKEHNEVLSRWIREAPEHWFGWFHRRFAPYVTYH